MNIRKILFSFGLLCGMQVGLFAAEEENIQDQAQEIYSFTLDRMYEAVYHNDYTKMLDWVEFITPEIVNRPDNDGYTILHIAAYTGSYEMTMILLAIEGIDISILTPHEESAYDIAFEKGYFLVAKELLKRDAMQSLKGSEEQQKALDSADNFDKLELLLNQMGPAMEGSASDVVINQQDEEKTVSDDLEGFSFERFFDENRGDEVVSDERFFEEKVTSLIEKDGQEEQQQVEEEEVSTLCSKRTDTAPKTWSEMCCIS